MKREFKEKKPRQSKTSKKSTRYSQEVTINGSRIYISVGKRREKKNSHGNVYELLPVSLRSDNAGPSPEIEAFAKILYEMISAQKNGTPPTEVTPPTRLLGESTSVTIEAEEVPITSKMKVEPGVKNSGTINISWQGLNGDIVYLLSFRDSAKRHCIKQVETENPSLVLRLNRFLPEHVGTEITIEVTAGVLRPGETDSPGNRDWNLIDTCQYLLQQPEVENVDEVILENEEESPRFKIDYIFISAIVGIITIAVIFFKFPNILGLK